MATPRSYSPRTREALHLLGGQIAAARKARHWTVAELAERVGVSQPTARKIERGDPTVALGVAFEAASLVGVPLFDADDERRAVEAGRLRDRLAVLPGAVRQPKPVDDDF